jgi:hypothetical protein
MNFTRWVELTDGCTLRVPLAWFPCLLNANPAERELAGRISDIRYSSKRRNMRSCHRARIRATRWLLRALRAEYIHVACRV